MNRLLYQLSYAAMGGQNSGIAEISFVIISKGLGFVKRNLGIFEDFFGEPVCEVMRMRLLKKTALFTLGGAAYVGLEMLWRGRSHSSMFLAGGSCFILLGKLQKSRVNLPVRAICGAGVITGVELLTGLLVNRDYRVWDYRKMPLQFRGQICLPYTLLWMPLSLGAMELYRLLDRS